ncbi:Uncharacterized conserved protein YdeI, YjbR/CyaY-like superfamily, DUF1801 family [Spirosomataceae bacterium TFI 002]|nr:Uncharacterized conserved protein YdeI, YjbR/CyaY-like superfamily, DUF1801 family [Spirosomataceae bacterium TFI 002]
MNPQVDQYLGRLEKWQEELTILRNILLDCGLEEQYKWKQPCYAYKGTNIIIIGSFKTSCIISFFKGTLLNDPNKVLESPGENSQATKWIKFTSLKEVVDLKDTIKAYIFEAIEIEKAGLKVEMKKSKNLDLPEELLLKFKEKSAFQKAFEALTPGRQRAYNLHFTGAKQSATRTARIEKYEERILAGIGINDCTCGHTKRKPTCDGSHKYL